MVAKPGKPKQATEPKAKPKAKVKPKSKAKAEPKAKSAVAMPSGGRALPSLSRTNAAGVQDCTAAQDTHCASASSTRPLAAKGKASSPGSPTQADSRYESAPMSLGVYQAQPMKQAVEQFIEAHHEKEPEPLDASPSVLPMIRKALDSHEIMEYLADCEFRLDASTAKHGDTYRLFVDDYPTDMAIVCKAGRCTIGNKSHPTPADAARTICDVLLAKISAGIKRK